MKGALCYCSLVMLAAFWFFGDAYTIRIYPQVVMANGAVRITCHVPELPVSSQDTLEVGIEGFTNSVFQIHGTPWTKETIFEHVPCGSGDAFCAVVTDSDTRIAKLPILIAGCEER